MKTASKFGVLLLALLLCASALLPAWSADVAPTESEGGHLPEGSADPENGGPEDEAPEVQADEAADATLSDDPATAGPLPDLHAAPDTGLTAHDETTLLASIEAIESEGIITLDSDIAITNRVIIPSDKSIVIRSETGPRTIKPDSTYTIGGMVSVTGHLTLQNVVIDGDKGSGNLHQGITVSGGSLVLGEGAAVTRCAIYSGSGAGVLVTNGGYLVIDGGEISHNETDMVSASGGGLGIKGATATLQRGSIHHNTSVWGGGVEVGIDGTFTMDGGFIEDNRAAIGHHGGGVHVYAHGTFIMNNGVISGNTANESHNGSSGYGGGVFVGQGTHLGDEPTDWSLFVMNGGIIEDNEATYGGGVAAQWNGQIEINGGYIKQNRAWVGGGIAATNGNRPDSVSLTLAGGEVSHNEATLSYGGGIFVDSATHPVRLTVGREGDDTPGPAIHHNESTHASAGGIWLHRKAVAHIHSGDIYENTAVRSGGGILLGNGATLTMTGGSIRDNIAKGTGGGIGTVADTNNSGSHEIKTLILSGGRVENNRSGTDGGGIHLDTTSRASLSGVLVAGNTATGNGGGIFTADYSYTDPADLTKYQNLALSDTVILRDNRAAHAYQPPENAVGFTHIAYDETSFWGGDGNWLHPLNNYDINYVGSAPPQNYLRVTYRPNGGTGIHNDSVLPGAEYTVRAVDETDIVRDGYTFTGWNTQADGDGHAYPAGDTQPLDADLDLYAQWQKDSEPGTEPPPTRPRPKPGDPDPAPDTDGGTQIEGDGNVPLIDIEPEDLPYTGAALPRRWIGAAGIALLSGLSLMGHRRRI